MGSIDGLLQQGQDLPPARVQDAPLGVGKSGEVQSRELAQGILERVELRGDRGRGRAQRGAALVGGRRRRASRVARERLAGRRIRGGAPGRQERQSLS
jgi:hypothetical protein